jgi:hypothetical protein
LSPPRACWITYLHWVTWGQLAGFSLRKKVLDKSPQLLPDETAVLLTLGMSLRPFSLSTPPRPPLPSACLFLPLCLYFWPHVSLTLLLCVPIASAPLPISLRHSRSNCLYLLLWFLYILLSVPWCPSWQAIRLRVHPLYLMIPGTVGCSYAFMLPVSTPPNSIAFASGHLLVKDMVSPGISWSHWGAPGSGPGIWTGSLHSCPALQF